MSRFASAKSETDKQNTDSQISDTLIYNLNIIDCGPQCGKSAVAFTNGVISWIGNSDDRQQSSVRAKDEIDAEGQWLSPGLIDCHTHLVYGGHRAAEFALKLEGASYEEISRKGGGIVSTVKATRNLSESALVACSQPRLQSLLAEGVTTVEIKSGYGLDLNNEIKMLRVARQLGKDTPVTIRTSFLGAHALPPEFKDKDEFIQHLIDIVMPQVQKEGLADAVDFFCEGIGFSRSQCEKICKEAVKLGLPIKGHVEQLSNLNGATLIAEYNGLSADHLEHLHKDDIPTLKTAGVVAVLLPGAFYSLSETKLPPIQAMRDHQLPMAIASDLNPGSSPIASLLNIMNLACVQYKLTPEEVLRGVTCHAARALGLEKSIGEIKVGMNADALLWPIDTPAQLCYGMNLVKPSRIYKNGIQVNV
ncbi:MAG: imidazolonepropionase [Pseudomonadales bacterium]|nr:imidazolonepropionase [Pseudomonadales bacterium]